MSAALTRHEPAASPLATLETFRFTADQRKLILDTCCGGASAQEALVLIGIAEMRGLNPLTQECYFVKRWDKTKCGWVWAVQVSIDAMRIKAEETGLYAGQDEPEYEYEPGSKVPSLARVRVYRKDWERPCVGVARYSEYVQKTKEGFPTKFWADMPHNQLAKVAESLALRKAFPRRLAKLYTADEMAQADNGAHDEMRGEVVQHPRTKSEPPPSLGPVDSFDAQLRAASTLAELKTVEQHIGRLAKAGKLGLERLAVLKDITKARRAELQHPPPQPTETILADNPAPDWMGGEEEVGPPKPEGNCHYCGKPVDADAVPITTIDGEVAFRCHGCFGGSGTR